jgi:hypothetical protein
MVTHANHVDDIPIVGRLEAGPAYYTKLTVVA